MFLAADKKKKKGLYLCQKKWFALGGGLSFTVAAKLQYSVFQKSSHPNCPAMVTKLDGHVLFAQRLLSSGAEDVVQSIECLPNEHEDQSLDAQHPHKSRALSSSAGSGVDRSRRIPGTH